MQCRLNSIPSFRTGVHTVHKAEWMECYIKARKAAIPTSNVLSSWRGARLFLMNKHCILHQLSYTTGGDPPPSTPYIALLQLLNISSPPGHNTLQSTNIVFNTELSQTTATSRIKTHARCLGRNYRPTCHGKCNSEEG